MSNQCILSLTDNESLVHVINKQTCKDKALMFFALELAKHIPGTYNSLADALPPLQVQAFRPAMDPAMDPLPTEIPQHLQPQNWVP